MTSPTSPTTPPPEPAQPVPVFEGPEKRLQINVVPDYAAGTSAAASLRTAISRAEWDFILTLARCTVLSVRRNEHYDAYILSESSLFVSSSVIVIKTCGTTTLLHCLDHLLVVLRQRGFQPEWISYSRRKYFFPTQQLAPHESFEDEVVHLRELLSPRGRASGDDHDSRNPDGDEAEEDAALEHYRFGSEDNDHWCIFVASLATADSDRSSDRSSSGSDSDDEGILDGVPHPPGSRVHPDCSGASQHDVTLEIMMRDLDPEVMRRFYQDHEVYQATQCAQQVTECVGIAALMPGADIDAHMFEPCGYSLNALHGESYYTIHITPEPQCSYVSFECNVRLDSYTEMVRAVIKTFAPGQATVALVSNTRLHSDVRKLIAPGKNLPSSMQLDWARGEVYRHSHSIGVWNLVHTARLTPPPSLPRVPEIACQDAVPVLH